MGFILIIKGIWRKRCWAETFSQYGKMVNSRVYGGSNEAWSSDFCHHVVDFGL